MPGVARGGDGEESSLVRTFAFPSEVNEILTSDELFFRPRSRGILVAERPCSIAFPAITSLLERTNEAFLRLAKYPVRGNDPSAASACCEV